MQFIDLGAQRARIENKLHAAIAKVIAEGRYILGPEVAAFEKQIVSYIGVKHAITCANGTDALLIPLMAFGIGPGDAVFCPSFTFAATAEVVALVGAEPVFIDVLPDTYTMDPAQLKKTVTMIQNEGRLKPKAIIPVDLFGLSADYNAISTVALEEKLFLIEDAAQSIGGIRDNIMCGAFGNVAATSFYPAKPLGCYGDGGAIFTDNDDLAAIMRSILFHGRGETQYENIRIGLNSRLDTIQAAILIEKLAILEDEINKRSHIAACYDEGLKDVVKVPTIPNACRSAYAQYTIQAEDRDGLQIYLRRNGIPSVVYYVKPLHLQIAYRHFPYAENGLLVSEKLSKEVLSLPMHPYLSDKDQDKIISSIYNFYKA
ncbi:MAG: aminotransferase [Candidatus Tokpelaia sp. JSC188]|nr:MAG: aminotransferase [Candidatus Tokpelaia sp. JSC188]